MNLYYTPFGQRYRVYCIGTWTTNNICVTYSVYYNTIYSGCLIVVNSYGTMRSGYYVFRSLGYNKA